MKKALIEEISAFIAIPAKMILFDEIKLLYLLDKLLAIKNIMKVVINANIKDMGVNNANGRKLTEENTIIAPKPAPADIPSNPGSARLLRRRDCNTKPEHDKAAPTIRELRTLGNLYSKRIFFVTSLPDEKTFNISDNLMSVEPRDRDTMTAIINNIREKSNIKALLYNFKSNLFENNFVMIYM